MPPSEIGHRKRKKKKKRFEVTRNMRGTVLNSFMMFTDIPPGS